MWPRQNGSTVDTRTVGVSSVRIIVGIGKSEIVSNTIQRFTQQTAIWARKHAFVGRTTRAAKRTKTHRHNVLWLKSCTAHFTFSKQRHFLIHVTLNFYKQKFVVAVVVTVPGAVAAGVVPDVSVVMVDCIGGFWSHLYPDFVEPYPVYTSCLSNVWERRHCTKKLGLTSSRASSPG